MYDKDYWKNNNIEKPASFVVCAACEFEGVVVLGARHWDYRMYQQYDMMRNSNSWRQYAATPEAKDFKQGFINQFGEFLTRKEAMIDAKKAGQNIDIAHGCGGDENTLYSEGLY